MLYQDQVSPGFTIRTFSGKIDSTELVWHRDEHDREVTPLENESWFVQLDDRLPIQLDRTVKIPAGMWHRLIKGKGDLTVKIIERR
jgi:hypothetical protein